MIARFEVGTGALLTIPVTVVCCRWAHNLITLQPKCKIDMLLIANALCLFDAYCKAAQEQVSRRGGHFGRAFPPFPLFS